MGQVITFFGWLLIGVGGTLLAFGHLMQGYLYGWANLWRQFTEEPLTTALFLLAFVPGGLLLAMGALVKVLGRRADEKWAARQAKRDKGVPNAPPSQES